MKVYVKTFINPLLALAFKEGIDFVGDQDYKAMEPKKITDKKWEVIVEHDVEDEEDDENELDDLDLTDNIVAIHTSVGAIPIKNDLPDKNKKAPLKEWMEQQINTMEPVDVQFAPGTAKAVVIPEVIHLPIKTRKNVVENSINTVSAPIIVDSVEPCGECLHCASGADCIRIINAACLASAPNRK